MSRTPRRSRETHELGRRSSIRSRLRFATTAALAATAGIAAAHAIASTATSPADARPAAIAAAGPSSAPGGDSYDCYLVRNHPVRLRTLTVVDALGPGRATIAAPTSLCYPAAVNSRPVLNHETHLSCYATRTATVATNAPAVDMRISNYFGAAQQAARTAPDSICVVTSAQDAQTPVRQAPLRPGRRDGASRDSDPPGRDGAPVEEASAASGGTSPAYYRCYGLRHEGPPFAHPSVIADHFGEAAVTVGDPASLCLPSLAAAAAGAQGLACYAAQIVSPAGLHGQAQRTQLHDVRVQSRLGSGSIRTVATASLCAPSAAVIAPPAPIRSVDTTMTAAGTTMTAVGTSTTTTQAQATQITETASQTTQTTTTQATTTATTTTTTTTTPTEACSGTWTNPSGTPPGLFPQSQFSCSVAIDASSGTPTPSNWSYELQVPAPHALGTSPGGHNPACALYDQSAPNDAELCTNDSATSVSAALGMVLPPLSSSDSVSIYVMSGGQRHGPYQLPFHA